MAERRDPTSPIGRLLRRAAMPLTRFLHLEAASGAVLLGAAAVALVWANSPFAASYGALWGTELTLRLGAWHFSRDLGWWVNDGLMALFFFVVGLEIRRELHAGELSEPRRAALPVVAAVGGMAVPAAVYLALVGDHPADRAGWGTPMGGMGVLGAAASIFFAYVGFDAVSTAAEETKNPNRNIPIGLIGSLAVCTIFYLLVGYGAVGANGSQPVMGSNGMPLPTGSPELAAACQASQELVCSKEPLAAVLRGLGFAGLGNLIGLAAGLALPSVILMMIYGQTRIFFVMSRDGLLPEFLSKVHPKFHTPHVVTMITGIGVAIAAAFFNVGALADISNTGTLFAFIMVAIGVLILRRTQPIRPRPFRTPIVWVICPLAVAGCLLLFVNLSAWTIKVFFGWAIVGGIVYLAYGKRHSNLGRLSAGGS